MQNVENVETPHLAEPTFVLGDRIFKARCEAGYRSDAAAFALLIGCSRDTLRSYETYGTSDWNGKRPPKGYLLDKIEEVSGTSLHGADDPRSTPPDGATVLDLRTPSDLGSDRSCCTSHDAKVLTFPAPVPTEDLIEDEQAA